MLRHRAAAPMFVAAALCLIGCAATDPAERASSATVPPATVPAPLANNALGLDIEDVAQGASTEPAEDASPPVISPPRSVIIPSIEVDASIIDLGLTSDGALETPTDFDLAGWWAGGTVADESGPTVIVGHVDDQDGPAVFFRLQELEQGDAIIVVDALGRETSFTVVDKGLYDKASFPTDRVYGASDAATLRLVTCGGEFDRSERSYESNWVIYAVS